MILFYFIQYLFGRTLKHGYSSIKASTNINYKVWKKKHTKMAVKWPYRREEIRYSIYTYLTVSETLQKWNNSSPTLVDPSIYSLGFAFNWFNEVLFAGRGVSFRTRTNNTPQKRIKTIIARIKPPSKKNIRMVVSRWLRIACL